MDSHQAQAPKVSKSPPAPPAPGPQYHSQVLGGSWLVISAVIGPRIWVTMIVTPRRTPLIVGLGVWGKA